MRLTRLQLAGFKSFGEPVLLPIETGITAIVGPNGSGKSNIIEALRWVMGESSPRRLRGGQAQDLIFSGSVALSGRNIAQVDLEINLGNTGTHNHLPPPLNREENITVCRKVERGGKTSWMINGSELRGRDVRLLFADAASGARSNAIIGQGEVAAIVTASSQSRRLLLEEAAGITGLASRRKEALTKLRAADTNMVRIGDILTLIDSQLDVLKKQERQAQRYRVLTENIEHWEIILWLSRRDEAADAWTEATKKCKETQSQSDARKEKLQILHMRLGTAQNLVEQAIEKRDTQTYETRRCKQELADIDRQRQTGEEDKKRLEQRARGIQADIDSATRMVESTSANVARLEEEIHQLEQDQLPPDHESNEDSQTCDALTKSVDHLGQELHEERATIAHIQAERDAIKHEYDQIRHRDSEYRQSLATLEKDIRRIQALIPQGEEEGTKEGEEGVPKEEESPIDLDALHVTLNANEHAYADARKAEEVAKSTWLDVAQKRAIQERSLADGRHQTQIGHALIDSLSIAKGWERALMAALGDDLAAPMRDDDPPDSTNDANAPAHASDSTDDAHASDDPPDTTNDANNDIWHGDIESKTPPTLPEGITPLSRHVQGPDFLTARLARIGIVTSPSQGKALQASLAPSHRLVDRQGRMWRWDGFFRRAGEDVSIRQWNEEKSLLENLRHEEAQARKDHQQSDALARAAHQCMEESRAAMMATRQQWEKNARQEKDTARHRFEIERLEGRKQEARRHQLQTEARRLALMKKLQSLILPQPNIERQRIWEKHSLELTTLRERQATAQAQTSQKAERLDRLKSDVRRLQLEQQEMGERRQSRVDDRAGVHTALQEMANLPQNLADKERNARVASGKAGHLLATQEKELADQRQKLNTIECHVEQARAQSAQDREEHARWQEKSSLLEEKTHALNKDILRIFSRSAEQLALELPAPKLDQDWSETTLEEKITTARKQRENIGPVNLQACEKMEEEETRQRELSTEMNDLEKAKTSLQKAIDDLERRSKEKLLQSFELLQKEFTALFHRFFPSGACRLAITDGADSLDFGLDVFVTLPGGKQRPLSLLSGGEQSLTGLALVLASFLANPSPILVLDEVDAALDESNLDVLCSVLQDILKRHRVPVLIVTHNVLTMSRAERLYGVTISQAGISRLAAVDLERAAQLRQAS